VFIQSNKIVSTVHFGVKIWAKGTHKTVGQHWAMGTEGAIGPFIEWSL
jgi:hypothetical protein